MIPIKDCFQNDHKPTKDSLSQYFFVQCSCPANILLRTIFTSVLDPFRESPSIMLGCGGKKDTDMCGVAGFFVGCSISDTCPLGKDACKLVQNANAMRNWYEQSTVRRAPRRILNEDDLNGHLYPMALAPVTQHPLVAKLDGEKVDKILTNHLYLSLIHI